MNPIRVLRVVLLLSAIAYGGNAALLQLHAAGANCSSCKSEACCPKCCHQCQLKVEKVDEEKSCFNVESKTICIPRVVFPWQSKKNKCDSCCGKGCSVCVHNGAKVRCVNVLKVEKYKCPKCKYTWSPKDDGCCGTGCASR